ncbi:hypothetical protein G7Y89_g4492 [Cudoniella acicularis]|uniref:Uncharacterized protein n=1 Tax=Cudoniella acicularis TaxID=354080 RepID=A0A8H4RPC1_9HELO|nr:hypothetical protein G7Y89_g4492 [Cudoniella acicularis]
MEQRLAKKREERQKAQRKQAEAAACKEACMKEEAERIRRQYERKAEAEAEKAELYEKLLRDRAFRDSDTRSDLGRPRLKYDTGSVLALARQIQDSLLFLDERTSREPDFILEELAQLVETRRRQSRRWPYSGSSRSSLESITANRIEAGPKALYGPEGSPELRKQVEEIVADLWSRAKLNEKENDPLPLPEVQDRASSDGYGASDRHRRTRNRDSDSYSATTTDSTTSHLSQEAGYINNDQEPPPEFSHSASRQKTRPPSLRGLDPGRYSRKSRDPRDDTGIPDAYQPVGRNISDSGYSSSKTAQSAGSRDLLNDVRLGGKEDQPIFSPGVEGHQNIQRGRNIQATQVKPRGRGYISSKEVDTDESDDPQRPSRKRTPYIFTQREKLPPAPEVPSRN